MTDISPYVKSSKLTAKYSGTSIWPNAEDEQRWREYAAGLPRAALTLTLPEGWTVSLHRAPNPLGSRLKTEEPIYITLHTAECTREQQ